MHVKFLPYIGGFPEGWDLHPPDFGWYADGREFGAVMYGSKVATAGCDDWYSFPLAAVCS